MRVAAAVATLAILAATVAAEEPAAVCTEWREWYLGSSRPEVPPTRFELEAAIRAADRTAGATSAATCREALAEVALTEASFDEALELATAAAALARANGDRLGEAWALTSAGDACYYLDRFPAAVRYFTGALEAFAELEMPRATALAEKNLGVAFRAAGRLDLALHHFERATEVDPTWRDSELAVSVLGNLGTTYQRLGAWRRALATFEEGLEIARQRGELAEQADLLIRMGRLYFSRREYERARDALEAAVRAAEADPSQVNSGEALAVLAWTWVELGDRGRGLALLERSLEHNRTRGARVEAGFDLLSLAHLVLPEDPDRCEALIGEALELVRGLAPPWRSAALHDLAAAAAGRGETGLAIERHLEAVAEVETRVRGLQSRTARQLLLSTSQRIVSGAAEALLLRSVSQANDGDARRAFEVLERGRALAGLESPEGSWSDDDDSWLQPYGHLADELAEMRSRLGDAALPERERGLLESEIERVQIEADEKVMARPTLSRPLSPTVVADLQQQLQPDEVALAYLFGDEAAWVFVVSHDFFAVERLPEEPRALERRIEVAVELGQSLDAPAWRVVARRLDEELLHPVRHWFPAGVRRLIVVPDGPLYQLPFEALSIEDGRRQDGLGWLIEELEVSTVPSLTLLGALRRTDGAGPDAGVLVVADPLPAATGAGPPEPAMRVRRSYGVDALGLAPLPASGWEAEVVRHVVGRRVRILTRGRATEAELRGAASAEIGVLHFATHALVDAENPRGSALILTQDGLDDGLLRPPEIAALRLRPDLVVLSACRTAAGAVVDGVGVLGLARAFLSNGARSVVATRWNIEDAATARLMASFYRHLAAGRATGDALRHAKLELADELPPRAWASFVLIGDPTRSVELRNGRPWRRPALWLSGGAVLALFAIVAFRRG